MQQTDWAEHADTVAALGHPLRLTILQHLLEGERTVAQLVDELGLASTGVAYHHLTSLQAAGWVTSPRRGAWALPAPRIVPLLTILIALEKG
nr:helix-turn-helix domain-containing protein [Brachybacterium sp. Marseille-Q7125]